MSMNCPNCAEPLGERGFFCKVCAGQARCMKCRELLEPDAAACVECGTRVGLTVDGANGTATQTYPGGVPIPANRNTLTYHEDRNSRSFEASLTDSAMDGLGDVFGELFAQPGVGRTILPGGQRTFVKDIALDQTKQLQSPRPEAEQQQQEQSTQQTENTPTSEPAKESLLKIFNLEGQVLELSDDRLKAKSAADYYKRLTYLFLYAQEVLLGRTATPRSELSVVLTAAKVNNGNCRFWLGKKVGFTVDDEDRMKLVAGSREQAIKTVGEILDNNVADEWHPDTRTVRARGPRKKK